MARLNCALDISFITPCFCSGTDKTRPEIRVQSIRGQLRWWYRALGATQGMESALFGSGGSESRASAVQLRVGPVPASTEHEQPKIKLVKKDSTLPGYMWHFLYPTKKDPIVRVGFDAGARFRLHLSAAKPETFKTLLALTYLWVRLGGLGVRSTRGAGSMKLERCETVPDAVSNILRQHLTQSMSLTAVPEVATEVIARTNINYLTGDRVFVRADAQQCSDGKAALLKLNDNLRKWRSPSVSEQERRNDPALRLAKKPHRPDWMLGSSEPDRLQSPFHLRPLVDYTSGRAVIKACCLMFPERLTLKQHWEPFFKQGNESDAAFRQALLNHAEQPFEVFFENRICEV